MSVVLTMKHFTYATRETKCSVCGGMLRPPYVEWHGHTPIYICGDCCVSIKPGLTTDIIQVAAVTEIRRQHHGHYYTGAVLERMSHKESEDKIAKQWDFDVGIMSNRIVKKV